MTEPTGAPDVRALIEAAIERAARDEDLAELAAAARPRVVEWRWLPSRAPLHDPEPFHAERKAGLHGATWPVERDGEDGCRIGLDAEGRPVIEEGPYYPDSGRQDLVPWAVWTHGPGLADERSRASDRRIAFDDDGRVAAIVEARRDRIEVSHWTWAPDGVRIDAASLSHGDHCRAHTERVNLAADGTVRDVLVANGRDRRTKLDPVAALLDGLQRAAALTADRVAYSDRASGPTPPLRADLDGLVNHLAGALDGAVRTAVSSAALDEIYVLVVGADDDIKRSSALPQLELASAPLRDALTRAHEREDIAVDWLFEGFDRGLAVSVALSPLLDDDAMRAWRELRAPANFDRDAVEHERRRGAQHALETELTRRLTAPPTPSAAVEPFLALVEFDLMPSEDKYDRRWRAATAAVGSAHVAAFRRSVSGRAAAPPAGDPLTDRGALAELLACRGVPEAEAARLAGDAWVAFDLVSPLPEAPPPRSRLGGPPLLPPGKPWPEGRTFIAGIDLAELPATGLPHEGWVLVFSAADDGDVTKGVVVLDVAPGTEPVPAEGPALVAQPVSGRPWLNLQRDPPGLDPTARVAFERVRDELMFLWIDRLNAIPAPSEPRRPRLRRRPEPAPLLSGTNAVGGQSEGDTAVLLRLGWEPAMGFEPCNDRGIELRVSPQTATARDWARVEAADVHSG